MSEVITKISEPPVESTSNGRHRYLLSRKKFMAPEQRASTNPELYFLEENCAPFIHEHPVHRWHPRAVFCTLIGVFLAPLRLLATVPGFFVPAIAYFFIYLGQNRDEPLSGRRSRLFSAILRFQCKLGLFIWGFHVKSIKTQNEEVDAPIIANHTSFIDILILVAYFGAGGFVAKEGVRRAPVLGLFSDGINCVYLSRTDPNSRKNTALQIERRCLGQEKARDGHVLPVTVFPEGCTSNGRHLLTFKPGVFRAGRPVRPVVIDYPSRTFSTTWESLSMLRWFAGALCQPFNRLNVRELPLYTPSPAELAHPALYADNVRRAMAGADGRGVCNLGTEHKMTFLKYLHGGSFAAFETSWGESDLGSKDRAKLEQIRKECGEEGQPRVFDEATNTYTHREMLPLPEFNVTKTSLSTAPSPPAADTKVFD